MLRIKKSKQTAIKRNQKEISDSINTAKKQLEYLEMQEKELIKKLKKLGGKIISKGQDYNEIRNKVTKKIKELVEANHQCLDKNTELKRIKSDIDELKEKKKNHLHDIAEKIKKEGVEGKKALDLIIKDKNALESEINTLEGEKKTLLGANEKLSEGIRFKAERMVEINKLLGKEEKKVLEAKKNINAADKLKIEIKDLEIEKVTAEQTTLLAKNDVKKELRKLKGVKDEKENRLKDVEKREKDMEVREEKAEIVDRQIEIKEERVKVLGNTVQKHLKKMGSPIKVFKKPE